MPGRKMVKWIKAIFTKPFIILKSIYYNILGKNEDLALTRLDICNSCPQNLDIKFVGGVCGECGCVLDNKTRVKDEHCDLCKW